MVETFGQRIKTARLALGYTQDQLAEAVQCDQGYLSELERGLQVQPGGWLIRRLAGVLHLSATELWESLPVLGRPADFADPFPGPVDDPPELLAIFDALNLGNLLPADAERIKADVRRLFWQARRAGRLRPGLSAILQSDVEALRRGEELPPGLDGPGPREVKPAEQPPKREEPGEATRQTG